MFYFFWLISAFLPQSEELNLDFPGNAVEVKEVLALSNYLSFERDFKHCGSIIPLGYRLVHQIEETPLHNKILVFKKEQKLAVIIRGTISETNSWLENIHFLQIPAQGKIRRDQEEYNYSFSAKNGAAVHSGFALATTYFWQDLKSFLSVEIDRGVNEVIFAGHSQGGALAQLLQSDLYWESYSNQISISSYAFGSPSVGNEDYADDFNRRFSQNDNAFRFINSLDPVVYMPIINYKIPLHKIGFDYSLDLELLADVVQLGRIFLPEEYEDNIKKASALASEFRSSRLGIIDFPEYASTNFFVETGYTIQINSDQSKTDELNKRNVLDYIAKKISLDLSFDQHRNLNYYHAIFDYLGGNNPRKIFTKQLDFE